MDPFFLDPHRRKFPLSWRSIVGFIWAQADVHVLHVGIYSVDVDCEFCAGKVSCAFRILLSQISLFHFTRDAGRVFRRFNSGCAGNPGSGVPSKKTEESRICNLFSRESDGMGCWIGHWWDSY
jgi:hypothetical protein